LGHVGIYRALVKAGGLSERDEPALSAIYLRQARHELEQMLAELSHTAEQRAALPALPWLASDLDVLGRPREMLAGFNSEVIAAIDELEALANYIRTTYPQVRVHLDLGELRGYHYHTGCLFAAYSGDSSEPIAKGGRYDHIGEVFGR